LRFKDQEKRLNLLEHDDDDDDDDEMKYFNKTLPLIIILKYNNPLQRLRRVYPYGSMAVRLLFT
jgi:hypothetical protein